jgi:hypothetical protein
MERLGALAACLEQPVADAERIGVAKQRDVIARLEAGFGILHQHAGAAGQERHQLHGELRQKQAEEREFQDGIAQPDRESDQQERGQRAQRPAAK